MERPWATAARSLGPSVPAEPRVSRMVASRASRSPSRTTVGLHRPGRSNATSISLTGTSIEHHRAVEPFGERGCRWPTAVSAPAMTLQIRLSGGAVTAPRLVRSSAAGVDLGDMTGVGERGLGFGELGDCARAMSRRNSSRLRSAHARIGAVSGNEDTSLGGSRGGPCSSAMLRSRSTRNSSSSATRAWASSVADRLALPLCARRRMRSSPALAIASRRLTCSSSRRTEVKVISRFCLNAAACSSYPLACHSVSSLTHGRRHSVPAPRPPQLGVRRPRPPSARRHWDRCARLRIVTMTPSGSAPGRPASGRSEESSSPAIGEVARWIQLVTAESRLTVERR